MFRRSRFVIDAAHEAARKKQLELLARRKGVYEKHVVFKMFGWGLLAFSAYYPFAFWWSSQLEEGPDALATPTAYHVFETIPFDGMSRLMGNVATSTMLPEWVHRRLIDLSCSVYGIDLSECDPEDVASWKTLQDFFERKLKHGARPIDHSALVTSPCDGELIRWGVVGPAGQMVQVKGCTYTISNLFRTVAERPSQAKTATERYYFAFRLAPGDYHRFHSPIAFTPAESVHVPGYLFPVMRAATRYLPMLYVNNERVVLNGTITSDKGLLKAKDAAASEEGRLNHNAMRPVEEAGGKLSIAFVGATCVGGIALNMDNRIRTNMPEPPPYALHRKYDKTVAPLVAKGEELGRFKMGSAIVMIVDVPKDATIAVGEGQTVKVGQAIINASA